MSEFSTSTAVFNCLKQKLYKYKIQGPFSETSECRRPVALQFIKVILPVIYAKKFLVYIMLTEI